MQILLFSFKNTDEKAIKIFKWMDTSKDLDLTILRSAPGYIFSFKHAYLSPFEEKASVRSSGLNGRFSVIQRAFSAFSSLLIVHVL